MKRYVWPIMGLIFFAIMGCSKGDKKNSSQPGPQAATATPAEITLTAGEGDEMTFTISLGGEVQASLTGAVQADMKRAGAMSSEDGSRTADVLSVSGKKHIYIVLHDEEGSVESKMYLFSAPEDTYTLRISGAAIGKDNALSQILSALEVHIDDGMSLDGAVSHMVNALNADSSLTFETYAEGLGAKGSVVLDPPESNGEGGEEDFGKCGENGELCNPVEEDAEEDFGKCGENGELCNPVEDLGEPTPVAFPPAVKPPIVERPVPRPAPRPVRPLQGGGGSGVKTEEPGGRNVIVQCYPKESKFVVEGQMRSLPRMMGCFDRNHKDDKFRASVILDQSMMGVNSMRGLKLSIDIDLSEAYFVKKAQFKAKPVVFPNNGAKTDKGGKKTIYYGANVGVFDRYYEMDSPFRDSMRIELNCKVQRTYRSCGN